MLELGILIMGKCINMHDLMYYSFVFLFIFLIYINLCYIRRALKHVIMSEDAVKVCPLR